MNKKIDFEMKYIGWNLGATRVERDQKACDIEILEMKIDDVDILKELDKLESVKTWLKENFDIEYQKTEVDEYSLSVTNTAVLELLSILEVEPTSEVKSQGPTLMLLRLSELIQRNLLCTENIKHW